MVELGADGRGAIVVSIAREPEAGSGTIVLELELPEGVKVADRRALRVEAVVREATIPIEAIETGSFQGSSPVVVVGKIRMPGGTVRLESEVRPILTRAVAENSGDDE